MKKFKTFKRRKIPKNENVDFSEKNKFDISRFGSLESLLHLQRFSYTHSLSFPQFQQFCCPILFKIKGIFLNFYFSTFYG